MKWQRPLMAIAVCVLLMGQMLVKEEVVPTQKSKTSINSTLEEYQRIQEGNSNFRTFSYEEGAPKGVYFTTRDNYGYLWLQSYIPGSYGVHRFNGTKFTDLQDEEKLIKTDSLFSGIIQTQDKTIHLATRHYLLRWMGYRFARYAFPKDDRIIQAQAAGNRILCIGAKGYAVLDGNRWIYRRTPILGATSADRNRYFSGYGSYESFRLSVSSLDRADNAISYSFEEHETMMQDKDAGIYTKKIAYPWKNDFFLQYYTKAGRHDLKVLEMEKINSLAEQGVYLDPRLINPSGGDPHIYFIGTNLIFRIDGENHKVIPMHLPEGSKILAITRDKQNNLWIGYVHDKQLYLQDLGDAITSMGMKYYVPEGEYNPDCDYYIQLDDETRMIVQNDLPNAYKKLYRLNRGYPELSKCVFPELNIKGDYQYHSYPETHFFTHYLCISVPRKDMPGVHRIYLYDMLNGQKEYLDVSDPAPEVSCWDFNPEGRIILVKGRDRLLALPLQKTLSQLKSFEGKEGHAQLMDSSKQIALSYTYYNSQTKKTRRELYSQRLGQLTNLFSIDNGFLSDNWKADRAYIADEDNIPTIREVNLMNGKVKTISPKKTPYRVLPDAEGCYVMYEDLSLERHRPSGMEAYSAAAVTAALEPIAQQAGLGMELIGGNLYPEIIGEGLLFFPYLDAEIQEDAEGNRSLNSVRISGLPEQLPPHKMEYVPGSTPRIRIPSFTYSLKDGKLTWQPKWISVNPLPKHEGDVFLVKYWEGTPEKGRIRFSRFEKGKLLPSDHDFTYSFQGGSYPWIDKHHDANGIYFEVDDNLYFYRGKRWKAIPLSDYKVYGSLRDVDRFGEDLWLTFGSALVRYNLISGQSFVFSSKDGIPTDLRALYQEHGKYYLLTDSGVYHFTPEEVGATLSIPWLQVNGGKYSATLLNRFSPIQNNLIIPVDILNTLFPERMKLTYCLMGYDKEWKSRDYTPQIEYPQLPPGKYEFQIYATSPTGRQSSTLSIPFRIRHHWYANNWAYLLYIVVLAFLARYLYQLRVQQLQQRNKMLEDTITDRTRELKERQQRLDSSIEYASLIQKSILPQESDLISAFQEHFILWRPRDVVGGDFYWLHTTPEGETIFALVDCTGHGVPGALLSMTVNSLLHTLVKDRGLVSPAEVFAIMHREIGTALHQEKAHTVQDGLEIAMIRLNRQKSELIFCGAGLHLLYLDNNSGELVQVRGDKYGIGGLRSHQVLSFAEHRIPVTMFLQLYLYTDGILDQPLPRGTNFRSMGHPFWLDFLAKQAPKPFSKQQQAIEEQLGDMLSYYEQRDDITVIGLKVQG